MNSWRVAFRLVYLLIQRRRIFWIALLLVTIASFFQPLRPYLYRYVIDNPLRQGDVSLLLKWGTILIFLSFLHAL
ncbi:MAG: hypothetical protein RMJ66_05480, partial [Bacteroidia bacterium]|nr:hypothetical protein [Bacteroidia bacterium]MDW8134500.1 hypothetical protein [Bacteroidia bacterium]